MILSKFDDNWSFISFSLLLLFMGLFYQVAWQYPVTDGYPLIERLLNPEFLINDFYTNTFKEFSPRLASAQVIVWLSTTSGIDYKEVIAYGNIVRIWLYGIGLYLLFLALSDKKTALVAFAFSALSFLSMPFLPAWWPISYDLTSSNIALVSAMFAWVYAVQGSVKRSFILLAITVYIHPIVGVQAMLISILIYYCIYGWKVLLDLFVTPAIYPFAILFCIAFFYNYFSYEQVLSDGKFIEINGQFRHGHHFILSHMEIEKWISTILMCTLCIGITLWLKQKLKIVDKVTLPVMCYSAAMVLLGLFFAELYPTRFMISFIPMRAFPILVPVIVLSFASLAVYEWKQSNFLNFFLLFLPFLPYNHTGLTWHLMPNHHEMMLPILVTFIVFFIVITNHLGWIKHTIINNLISRMFKNASSGLFLLPIALFFSLLAIVKFDLNIPTLENSAPIYLWINNNIPEDKVIVAELNAADNQKIRLISRRAIVVSKDFPFNELFYEEWFEKYTNVYIHRDKSRGRIDRLDAEELNTLLDKYSAHILIRTLPLQSNKYFTMIGEVQGENKISYIYNNTSMPSL
jgi:hypothetical protein